MSTNKLLSFPDLFRDAGLSVRFVPGWEERGSQWLFDPRVIIDHHTAAGSASLARPLPSLGVVTFGRVDLAGPLCNVLTGADGTVVMVAAGRSNNAGGGSASAYGATSNRHTIGHEAEHPGVGPASQSFLEVVAQVDAVICRAMGWDENRCIGHKEWAIPKGRKVDPVWSMDGHRARVRGVLGLHQFKDSLQTFTGEQMASYNTRRAAARSILVDLFARFASRLPDPAGRNYWHDLLDMACAKDARANDPMDTNANAVLIVVQRELAKEGK